MGAVSEAPPAPASVEAAFNYIHTDCDDGVLYELQRESSTLVFDPHRVTVRNARAAGEPFSLERNGFQLVRQVTDVDFADPDAVAARYHPQIVQLLKDLTGASDVVVFNDILRSESGVESGSKPAYSVHVDFDRESIEGFVRAVRPDADALLSKRFALINLWRGVATVERVPLAVMDASTMAPHDLRVGHIKMRPGEPMPMRMSGFNIAYSPDHRWYYFPRMQPDELLVFKLHDTEPQRVQFTAHSAFDDPTSPPDARPRRSMETRTVAFFD